MPESLPLLVVDLDGTVLHSDMLYESFWDGLGRDWRTLPRAGRALATGGRAGLKRVLAEAAHVDAATLPYNAHALDKVRSWRAQGGRTTLVTATDQRLAEAVAAHLGLFDEVHGSDGTTNLKGAEKAAFLDATYGAGRYGYMGDSKADLAVWAGAAPRITVDAAPDVRRRVDALDGAAAEHLATRSLTPAPYLAAMRPYQWLKNILVFATAIAAHRFDAETLGLALLAFVSFSIIASGVYCLNDLMDLGADRAHPRKRRRPFASGAVPIAHGGLLAGGLLAAGFAVAALLGGWFLSIMVGYFAVTTAYSMVLKRIVLLDICVLAVLYTTRIVAGGLATDTMPSEWLLAFAVFLFLSLAAIKRQAELVDALNGKRRGTSRRGYRPEDLPLISQIGIAAGYVAVLVMALYVNSSAVLDLYSTPAALWGICLVLLYWIGRMALVAQRGEMTDDPIVFALRDRPSRVCGLLVCLSAGVGALV